MSKITMFDPCSGSFESHIQSATWILDCYDVVRGEPMGIAAQPHNTLLKPTQQSHPDDDKRIAHNGNMEQKELNGTGHIAGNDFTCNLARF